MRATDDAADDRLSLKCLLFAVPLSLFLWWLIYLAGVTVWAAL